MGRATRARCSLAVISGPYFVGLPPDQVGNCPGQPHGVVVAPPLRHVPGFLQLADGGGS